jgi:hypothetical protein
MLKKTGPKSGFLPFKSVLKFDRSDTARSSYLALTFKLPASIVVCFPATVESLKLLSLGASVID